MADMSYSKKMTVISVMCGIVSVGLIGWGTVSAMGSTAVAGKDKIARIVAAKATGDESKIEYSSLNKADVDSTRSEKPVSEKLDETAGDASEGTEMPDVMDDAKTSGAVDDTKAPSNEGAKEVPVSVTSTDAGEHVPAQAAEAGFAGMVYDVVWGDTLSDISERYGISVDEIADLNGIRDVDRIYAGSSLRLPESARLRTE